jgi:hypothetical protein
MISEPMVHSAQTMYLYCVKISTISNELTQHPLEICYLGDLLGASKTISKPTVCFAQTLHRHQHYLQIDQNNIPHDPVNLEFHRVRPKWFLRLWYHAPIWCQDLPYLWMVWIKLALEPHHLGVPSGASNTIDEPVVGSAQTVHLSCIKISTISNQTESSFHLSLVT